MAETGTNYTIKWELDDEGVLTISPTSGSSGIGRVDSMWISDNLENLIDLTDDEIGSVTSIIFTGSIKFQEPDWNNNWVDIKDYSYFFDGFDNVESFDVTGLNTTGATNFSHMFSLKKLKTIIGLSSLDVSSGTDFSWMFSSSNLTELDLSSYPISDNSSDILDMISGMKYLQTVIFPNAMRREYAWINSSSEPSFNLGLAENSFFRKRSATNGDVTVLTDKDFFKLESGQGGTWIIKREGDVPLTFAYSDVNREANDVEIRYSYASTNAITVDVYKKLASESSFPSTYDRFTVDAGSGTGVYTTTVDLDEAYDFKIVATDGTTTIYGFPSTSSKILLMELSSKGDLETMGEIIDGSGNVLSEKADKSDLQTYAGEFIAIRGSSGSNSYTVTNGWKYCHQGSGWASAKSSSLANDLFTLNAQSSTGLITIKKRGVYLVNYAVLMLAGFTAGDQLYAGVLVNYESSSSPGAAEFRAVRLRAMNAAVNSSMVGSFVLRLKAGDKLGLACRNSTGTRGNFSGSGGTQLQISCLKI